MLDITESYITDDLDMLSEILNPVEEESIKFEEGENRVVSIFFLDVKGFTAMSEKMDSENVKRTMDKILTAFSNSIIKFGGHIDKYEGDLIMALFGSKITSETDTERAINAGLKILTDLKHVNKILNINLSIRIGINTGEVTTGKIGMKREGDFTVYGDAVNLASRMESNAQLNSIMISKNTKEIVEDYFIFEDLGEITVKGKEKPVSVYKVIKKNPDKIERWERDSKIVKNSIYVGRDKEINDIIRFFEISKNEIGSIDKDYNPFIIGLKGNAGIGKSRLFKEIYRKLDFQSYKSILFGYTKSYAQPAYTIWATMLKGYFTIGEGDSQEIIKEKLDQSFENLSFFSEEDKIKTLIEDKNVIGYIFGVKYNDDRLNNIDPKSLQTLINVSVRHTIEIIALKINKETKNPLIIFLDDCQWIDEPSLNLFKNIISTLNTEEKRENRSNKNIIFILTYRPQFEMFKEAKYNSRFTEIQLEPLSVNFSKELINSMLVSHSLPNSFIKKAIENSAGNPFFIEELMNSMIENCKIIRSKDTWILSDKLENIKIPLSLTNIILSRIDNLKDELKSILQRASVIGHHFYKEILLEISNKIDSSLEIHQEFSKLEKEKWFYSENIDKLENKDKYLFKHILTSDICYRTILRYNKNIYHKIIAEATEEIYKDKREFFAFIANHYEKSNPAESTKEFKKMLDFFIYAGDYAKEKYHNTQAIELYSKFQFYAKSFFDDKEENEKNKNTYHGEIKKLEDNYIASFLEKGTVLQTMGNWDDALENFIFANKISEKKKHKLYLIMSQRSIGIIHKLLGNLTNANDSFERCINICKEIDNQYELSIIYENLGLIQWSLGNYEKTIKYYDLSMEIAKKYDYKNIISILLGRLALIYERQGDYSKAIKFNNEKIKIDIANGNKRGVCIANGNIGNIYKRKNDLQKSEEYYNYSLKIAEILGERLIVNILIGNLGLLHYSTNNYEKAMEFYNISLKTSKEMDDKRGIYNVLVNIGLVYESQNNNSKALKCYRDSLDICLEIGAKSGISIAYQNIGDIYLREGSYPKALSYFKKSLVIKEKLGDRDGIAQTINNMSFIYLKLGNYDKAENLLKRCLKIAEELEDKKRISFSLNYYGLMNIEKKKYSLAEEYFNKAVSLAQKINIKYPLTEFLLNLGDVLLLTNKKGAYENIMEAYKISKEIGRKDTLFGSTILLKKIEFRKSNDHKSKLQIFKNLKKMLKDEKDKENIGLINFELAFMDYELKLDNSEFKNVAIKIYKKLYTKIPKIEYKNKLEEMEKL